MNRSGGLLLIARRDNECELITDHKPKNLSNEGSHSGIFHTGQELVWPYLRYSNPKVSFGEAYIGFFCTRVTLVSMNDIPRGTY